LTKTHDCFANHTTTSIEKTTCKINKTTFPIANTDENNLQRRPKPKILTYRVAILLLHGCWNADKHKNERLTPRKEAPNSRNFE